MASTPLKPQRITVVVAAEQAGWRYDRVVTERVSGLGRKRTKQLFSEGAVFVDGRRAKAGDRAQSGQTVSFEYLPEDALPDLGAPLRVVLETPELVVVDKPAGQPTAPLTPGERGTLANALVAQYPEMANVGVRAREPGLLHRLDTQTSGLLVAVRSVAVFTKLERALSSGSLEKRYLAIVRDQGLPENGAITSPIGPDPDRPERVLVFSDEPPDGYAHEAVSRYRIAERHGDLLLVELSVAHAVRHQIRAHLASLGHPILGDVVYGTGTHPALGERHALHASYIAWAGDRTLRGFVARSALPDELRALFG
jgi:23S rRNA pseudouridine1911/1915/1917 synthase